MTITLAGVGHVFNLDENIRTLIRCRMPEVVCLELDRERFEALRNRESGRETNPVYLFLESFQRRIAEGYGAEVGGEMLVAAETAREVGARVALIDRDARWTVSRLWRLMPLKEKVLLTVMGISSLLSSRKKIDEEIERIRSDDAYVDEVTRVLPTFRRVLIDERDAYMSDAILEISRDAGEVVAVVGDGHVRGIAGILTSRGAKVDIVRLRDLESIRKTNCTATYIF